MPTPMEEIPLPKMLTLRCMIVGQRSVMTIEIETDSVGGILKSMIEKKKKFVFPSFLLRIYLAKPNNQFDHPWLKTSDPAFEQLARGDTRVMASYMSDKMEIKRMARLINCFPVQPDEQAQTIHVLVKLPTDEEADTYMAWANSLMTKDNSVEKAKKVVEVMAKRKCPRQEPFFSRIVAPVRDSIASIAAWMMSADGQELEKSKTT